MKRKQKGTICGVKKTKKILIIGTLENPTGGSVFEAKMAVTGQITSFKTLAVGKEDPGEFLCCGF